MSDEQKMTPEATEQEAFQQALAGSDPSPIDEGRTASPLEQPPEEKAPPEPAPPAKFLGEYTEEDVLSRLQAVDSLEDKITQKLMGRFGEVGRELKELRESGLKDWEFDPELLAPLKEQDEGIYDAVNKALSEGLKVKTLDPQALAPIIQEQTAAFAATVHDKTQTQILEALVPNAYELSGEEGFGSWLKEQSDETLRAFITWDDENVSGHRNASQLIAAYKSYETHKAAEEEKGKENQDILQRSVVTRSQGIPADSVPLQTEEDGFEARLKELNG